MTVNEFRRWLKKEGVTFTGTGASHEKITFNGKVAVISRHGTQQIPIGTMNSIKKDLGLRGGQ